MMILLRGFRYRFTDLRKSYLEIVEYKKIKLKMFYLKFVKVNKCKVNLNN